MDCYTNYHKDFCVLCNSKAKVHKNPNIAKEIKEKLL